MLFEADINVTNHDINEMYHNCIWPLNAWDGADPNYLPYEDGPNALIFLCYRWDNNQHDDYITDTRLLIAAGIDQEYKWEGAHSAYPEDWRRHLQREIDDIDWRYIIYTILIVYID